MNWIALQDYSQINKSLSQGDNFIVFKHSTRCSISSLVMHRFEQKFFLEGLKTFYLDLISYRSISNQLAIDFKVEHQSPQVLFIQNGICAYHASHHFIDIDEINAKI